jgi:hypothetical protein
MTILIGGVAVNPDARREELPPAKTEQLRRLLRHLRFTQRVKYTAIARHTGISLQDIYKVTSKKAPGTPIILSKILEYCDGNGVRLLGESEAATVNDKNAQRVEPFRLDYILHELTLDEEKIAAAEKLTGKYLLFSKIRDEKIGVAWIELRTSSAEIPIPVFTARRPSSTGEQMIFKGFYYEYMRSVFLFGHIAGTPFTRFVVLIPIGAPQHRNDRYGIVTGASPNETLFASGCYLKWVGRKGSWRQYKDVLGERQETELQDFRDVLSRMNDRANITFSIARMSG